MAVAKRKFEFEDVLAPQPDLPRERHHDNRTVLPIREEDLRKELSAIAPHMPSHITGHPQQPAHDPALWAGTIPTRVKQITLAALLLGTVFVGYNFSGLACVAFLLFVCAPIASALWTLQGEPES